MRQNPCLSSRSFGAGIVAVMVVASATAPGRIVWAYTPESPEVKRLIEGGITYLESELPDNRLGGKALAGMAIFKHKHDPDHPRVVEAVKAIKDALGEYEPEKVRSDIYSVGLSTIFLLNLDPEEYRAEIECLLGALRHQQKPHGGWGYSGRSTGDTSMTQYGVLSCWEAKRAGFTVPAPMVEGVATWLLKTQDPSGVFGYQGTISPTFAPVPQRETSLSMAAAGLGSVFVCADMLGFIRQRKSNDSGLPSALKRIEKKPAAGEAGAIKTNLDPRLFQQAQARGVAWLNQNYQIEFQGYSHYYLYALERCMSFRELAEGTIGREAAGGSKWYNDGVTLLAKTQSEQGAWSSECGVVPDTAFSVLFLMRSTRKNIRKARNFGDGMLVGGRGLPTSTSRAEIRDGNVVIRPLLGPAERLLAMLDDAETMDYEEAADLVAELPPDKAQELMKKHADRLRRLAGNESAEARMAAVLALAKTRDLSNVPTLIYALSDPDGEIALYARDALRRIGRRPQGFGLSARPTEQQRLNAIEKWKRWYLAIRPDAEFAD